jgi:DNA-binding Lrp family transcriptional regulator
VRQGPIFGVSCTSGPRDLYLLISTDTLLSMDRYVDERIAVIAGVTGTRIHYLRTVFIEGSTWRLRVLDAEQTSALETMRPVDPPPQRKPAHTELVAAMATDVRRTAAELQDELGRSISVISRDIDAVLAAGWVRWRVDFAHALLGWTAGAMLWLDVPHPDLDRVVASLRTLPNVRLCASVTGTANLAVSLWLRDLHELDDIELRLATVYPRLRIRDRWIVPRIAKRTGYTLDLDSRRLDYIPISGQVVFED